MSVLDQFGLATQKAQFTRFYQIQTVFNLYKFFCGYGKKDDSSRQIINYVCIHHAHHCSHQSRDLCIVTTSMCGTRIGIGIGMAGDHERVEFANQCNSWARLASM